MNRIEMAGLFQPYRGSAFLYKVPGDFHLFIWLPTKNRCRRLKLSSSSMNRFSIWSQLRPLTLACLVSTAPLTAWTQSVTELPPQEVSGRPAGEELVGPYAQPCWSARGRFSADTDVYVLPPYSF